MLLAGKGNVSYWKAFFAQGFHHHLRLIWRDDLIFQALKENDRTGQAVGEVYRRALEIEIAPFRIRTNQAIEIPRLKLVRLFSQGFGVTDTEVTGTGMKYFAECERAQGRVTAGAATVNHQPFIIRSALGHQVQCAVDAVVHVDDAPLVVQSFAIPATIAGAATVVNIQHSDSTAGPILNARTKGCGRCRRRPAVALYQEWWPFIFRRDKVSVPGRIKETIRSLTFFSWELDRLGLRDITGIDLNIIRAPQDLRLTRS